MPGCLSGFWSAGSRFSNPPSWLNGTPMIGLLLKLAICAGVRLRFLLVLMPWIIWSISAPSLGEEMLRNTLFFPSMVMSMAFSSFSMSAETELGVCISTGSGGLNLVAMMKKDRIRNAMSTKGVISVSVLFLAILICGILNSVLYEMNYLEKSIPS